MINAHQQIDRNSRTVNSNQAIISSSTWTFAALTTGAVGAHTLFTVTGDVVAEVFAHCTTSVTGSGTAAIGTANSTQAFAATTTGTNIAATDWWQNATPTAEVGATVSAALPVGSSTNIILTVGTATLTAGVVTFYAIWRPLNNLSNLVVTTPA